MRPLLVITGRDNVATALMRLEVGQALTVGEGMVSPREVIPPGHKMAIAAIAEGAAVIKYGAPIGIATREIQAGDHVHTHNVASTRGRGDLQAVHD